ncbi:hypothetical protein JXQ70_08715 [bacterium]|nr:hypothetical protein [bacterium]
MKVRASVLITVISVVGFMLFVSSCGDDTELEAEFGAQNAKPHLNAISLFPGDRSDNYFDIIAHVGIKRESDDLPFKHKIPWIFQEEYLLNVKKISFCLEYWGDFVEFVLDYEPGDYFEKAYPDCPVRYCISSPYLDETIGLMILPVEVFIENAPPPEDAPAYYFGDLLTLKFRAKRSGKVPLNFSDRHGSVYDLADQPITGVGWYGGYITSYYE